MLIGRLFPLRFCRRQTPDKIRIFYVSRRISPGLFSNLVFSSFTIHKPVK
jgi:hypothetical protein